MDKVIQKKRWTQKKILLTGVGTALALLILYLIFFRDTTSRIYVEKERLTIATVERTNFQEFIPLDGKVLPVKTVVIDAIQGGRVEKIFVEDGALLESGDTILKLSNQSVELDYMYRETQMYDIINNLQNTKLNIEQTKFTREKEIADLDYKIDKMRADFDLKERFHKEELISDKEFEDARREFQSLKRQREISARSQKHDSVFNILQVVQIKQSIDRLNKNLALLKENLSNLYIRAPFPGQLSNFDCEIGETKTPGQNIGQIDVKDGFKVNAKVDERYITRVFKGQDGVLDFNGKLFEIQIHKIYTKVSNGAFEVDFIFQGEIPENIKIGQTLPVQLKFSGVSQCTVVPRGGFYQETGGNWIYVVDESSGLAYKRNIRIGRQNTSFYEVLEGLQSGEKVIVSSYESFGGKEKLIFR
ncbi:MAG: HlyD family efflux transporter periplasmic adaptor subunit [Bacteroidota bacterium]